MKKHNRLWTLETTSDYSLENMNRILKLLFGAINELLETNFQAEITKEIYRHAKQCFKASKYRVLAEEYVKFLEEHGDAPHKKEQKNLRERINRAIRESRFTEEELDRILDVQKRFGICKREERSPEVIISELQEFYRTKGHLPRQQRGDDKEKHLYREVKKCIKKSKFSAQQIEIYRELCLETPNYPMPSEKLVELYSQFVLENGKLPSQDSKCVEEKTIASRVAHRLTRGTFSEEQKEKILNIQKKYSRKNRKYQIMEEYRQFIQANNRLPLYSAEGEEGKLEKSMRYFLRTGKFSLEEFNEILKMRAAYQRIPQQLQEYVKYYKGSSSAFATEKYEQCHPAN